MPAGAEQPTVNESIVVTATRLPQSLMEAPAAVSVVEQPDIQDARATVGLEEPLNRVPGVFVQNSENFAQDVRIQIRGFGTRAAFGIREIRVLLDGLPLTLADGQTELDEIDLGAIDRIEVLRSAASSLYGNASGGVLQLFTEEGPDAPWAQLRLTGGSFGLGKYQIKGGGSAGKTHLFLSGSFLQLDGFRDHNASQKGNVIGTLRYDLNDRTDLTLLVTGVEIPLAKDPGGLTRQQADTNPRQARDLNIQLRADEVIEQGRLGLIGHHRLSTGELSGYGYLVYRDFNNRLPILPQTGDGIVEFHRVSPGAGARYLLDRPAFGWAQKLTLGIDVQRQDDDRRRFTNVDGARGALHLHQDEDVNSIGPYLREAVMLRDDIEVSAGVRYDRVRYSVDVDVPDPAGSGVRTFDAWSPAGAVRYSPRPWLSLFGDIGPAFQVPTTTELANPQGAGFNPDVTPQHAMNYETGTRLETALLRGSLTGFFLDITDELISFEAPSGRTFFRNAGRSQRYGLEVESTLALSPAWQWTSALTLMHAHFVDYGTPQGRFDGNAEPGIPPWQVYEELAYRDHRGWFAALDAFLVDSYFVDDANIARSPSYALVNLRAGFERALGRWMFSPYVGTNNLLDANYDGRVRLNAQGGRFFEPAPGFNVYGGIAVRVQL